MYVKLGRNMTSRTSMSTACSWLAQASKYPVYGSPRVAVEARWPTKVVNAGLKPGARQVEIKRWMCWKDSNAPMSIAD